MRIDCGRPVLALLALCAAGCGDSTGTGTGGNDTGLFVEPVDSGLDFSVFLTAPPGDPTRINVVDRGGTIFLRKNGVRQPTPFLDLTSLTGAGHEYGVYSFAFHPQYAQNRRFFVYYVDNNANTRVAEFLANADLAGADRYSR